MGLFRKWRMIIPAILLLAIFIYILWVSTDYMTPANVIGTVIVAGIIVYFIYLANSSKKYW